MDTEDEKKRASELLIAALQHAHQRGYDTGFEEGAAAAIDKANEEIKAAGLDYELVVFVL